MNNLPDVLCLNVSPSLQVFDKPLLRYLSTKLITAQWEYSQSQDDPCLLDVAVTMLHDYLKFRNRPIHLIGHSMGGLLGLLYARRHPERVRSLTLLAVGVYPAVNWQAHYYVYRQLFPFSREKIIAQMVESLFGYRYPKNCKKLAKVLEEDLDYSLSPHSLLKTISVEASGVEVPLMVCGSQDDFVVDPHSLQGWQFYLKKSDRIWQCPQGRHFFHCFYPQLVGEQIMDFWQELERENLECPSRNSVFPKNLVSEIPLTRNQVSENRN
ncbi:MAG: alpha/beta hydrolase [Okeania sp. SIO2H7]|nr:alpha/beta hydrolase [Okeania sp. SIO2H7]